MFDIDGVLIRGKNVLPTAPEALRKLYFADRDKPKFPVVFLTNGGGVPEATKAQQLTDWLGVNVQPSQVVLSHTPYRTLAPEFSDHPVLVVGEGSGILEAARSYGFKKIVTCKELAYAYPEAVPFWPESAKVISSRNSSSEPKTLKYGTEFDPIRLIKVYHDPSDWYLTLQVIHDVIQGYGVMGRDPSKIPPGTPQVQITFSNPDMLWANEYHMPRFAQGAFATVLTALYEKLSGQKLPVRAVFGKPNSEVYRIVEKILIDQAINLGHKISSSNVSDVFSTIYMVGDNPAADVRGARNAGPPWTSILVKTGVFNGINENCSVDPAHIVADCVNQAVDIGLGFSKKQ